MYTFADWLRNHPVAYPAILFVLTCPVSIYAGDIKRFLHNWPRAKFHAGAMNATANQLDLLKSLPPGNAYNLLIFFADQFIGLVYESLVVLAIVTVLFWAMHWKISAGIYVGVIAGNFVGRCNGVRRVLRDLGRYPQSVAKLEMELAEMQRSERERAARSGK